MIYLFKHTPSKYGEGGYVINRVCVVGLIKRFGGLILTNSSEVVYYKVVYGEY